ncbi:MAG: large repetitive protein [Miltoncostaeaceae bacterium]|nr:large repetitive protein [Miltoncostaeaceae bacterium]
MDDERRAESGRARPSGHGRLRIVLLACAGALGLLAAALAGMLMVGRAEAATPCQDRVGATYTIRVCLAPVGSPAKASVPVSATVTITVGSSPGIRRVIFYIDGAYLLTDYLPTAGSYGFTLNTKRFADGPHTLGVEALTQDNLVSARAEQTVTFANNQTEPPVNTRQFTPTAGTPPAPGAPLLVAAAGDGAGGEPAETAVVDLIASWNPNMFLYLGDVYEKGTAAEFDNWYGPPADLGLYGRFRAITNPAIGNHEYENGIAPGYFDYWDNVPHWYSFDSGGWHFIGLDSNKQFGQLAPGTPQYEWLIQDLDQHPGRCTMAFFHHPYLDVGAQGATPELVDIWRLLALRGVDIVLTGHDHTYQRWAPLDADGNPSSTGMTQFVVGTGGHALQNVVGTDARALVAVKAFGALLLALGPDGATFLFQSTDGIAHDAGYVPCVTPAPQAPPTTPTTPTIPTTPTTPTIPTTPTTPTTTGPLTPPVPRLTARLTGPPLAAPVRGRVVVRFTSSLAGRATLALKQGPKRLLLLSRASRRGANAIVLRAPARTGRYQVVLTVRARGKAVVLRGLLRIRPAARR